MQSLKKKIHANRIEYGTLERGALVSVLELNNIQYIPVSAALPIKKKLEMIDMYSVTKTSLIWVVFLYE